MPSLADSPARPAGWTSPAPDVVRAAIDGSRWHSAAIARALGISPVTVSRWRNGASPVGWFEWYTLSALLKTAPPR